jgi:hypothetical protein
MHHPYLTAFRAYLFAPRTRAWIDVMVWSSAQPHSVEDMMLLGRIGVWFELDPMWRRHGRWAHSDLHLHHHHLSSHVRLITPPFLFFFATGYQHPASSFQEGSALPVCASYPGRISVVDCEYCQGLSSELEVCALLSTYNPLTLAYNLSSKSRPPLFQVLCVSVLYVVL